MRAVHLTVGQAHALIVRNTPFPFFKKVWDACMSNRGSWKSIGNTERGNDVEARFTGKVFQFRLTRYS